ncbi:isoleucine-tRNA ligase [Oleoguttula sp. CCFEE 5521]
MPRIRSMFTTSSRPRRVVTEIAGGCDSRSQGGCSNDYDRMMQQPQATATVNKTGCKTQDAEAEQCGKITGDDCSGMYNGTCRRVVDSWSCTAASSAPDLVRADRPRKQLPRELNWTFAAQKRYDLVMQRFFPSRILRAAANTLERPDWSKTLHLPRSTFPARPKAAELEKYRQRCADELYAWQSAARSKTAQTTDGSKDVDNEFVLHDGPPYANGSVHAGHALNKILKDIIVRSQLSRGKRVKYQPGWDCHGLPIELKALQQRSASGKGDPARDAGIGLSALEIRQTANALASKTIEDQRTEFKTWGVMGEWDTPYKTMDYDFEIRQLGVFREMVKKGLIFRDYRPVYWSPSSRTALAEAELEYDDQHKCTAAFVKLPFVQVPSALSQHEGIDASRLHALIWTTTPWTLPANKAIAYNNDIEYIVIELSSPDTERLPADQLLLAKDRIEHVLSFLPERTTYKLIVDSIMGSELSSSDAACLNIFQNTKSRIVPTDFVTATSGTGLVHMAPGHGMEDYLVCQKYGIGPAFAPIDDAGCLTDEAWPEHAKLLTGLLAETKGGAAVLEALAKPSGPSASPSLLASHTFTHKSPIDWRTKKPVIVRATAQWFADVSKIKSRALKAIEAVHFIPESGRSRLKAFIEGRSQWCISRQRAWGVPIPALYHVVTGEVCMSDESIAHIIETIKARGTDAWFSDDEHETTWLHSSLEPGKWVRGKDTMDVWFDSGTTWTSLASRSDASKPLADVYVEGSDQHRGWFQSSLLTAVATQEIDEKPIPPYGTLITHGFILDGEGRKMSKSLGNVVSPSEIVSGVLVQQQQPKSKPGKTGEAKPQAVTLKGKSKSDLLGPDLLRLWVASSDYTRDVPISQQGLLGVQQALQKLRVTLKFLCGVLANHDPSATLAPFDNLTLADNMLLSALAATSREVWQSYQDYRFHEGVREVTNFVNADLSAFYFEVVKDTLYAGLSTDRQRVQSVLTTVLSEMLHWLAPIVPHLIEETAVHLPQSMKQGDLKDPLQRVWTTLYIQAEPAHKELVATFRAISAATKIAQERARSAGMLGSGLACRVEVRSSPSGGSEMGINDRFIQRTQSLLDSGELAAMLVISQAAMVLPGSEGPGGNEADEIPSSADWSFKEPVMVKLSSKSGEATDFRVGSVVVLPPEQSKCVRCWQYTAESEETPCERCLKAVAEQQT